MPTSLGSSNQLTRIQNANVTPILATPSAGTYLMTGSIALCNYGTDAVTAVVERVGVDGVAYGMWTPGLPAFNNGSPEEMVFAINVNLQPGQTFNVHVIAPQGNQGIDVRASVDFTTYRM